MYNHGGVYLVKYIYIYITILESKKRNLNNKYTRYLPQIGK